MKMLLGGAVGSLLGVISIAIWWKEFFNLMAGTIPVMLIIGGCFAIYLGFDEFKDTIKK